MKNVPIHLIPEYLWFRFKLWYHVQRHRTAYDIEVEFRE